MASYVLPQFKIQQIRNRVPQSTIRHQNAFIIGPNYQLVRYSEAAEKINGYLGSFIINTETEYAWPNLISGAVVDTDYTKILADEALLLYSTVEGSVDSTAYKLDLNGVETDPASVAFDEAVFHATGPAVGDYVLVSDEVGSEADATRVIVGFEYSTTPAAVTTPADSVGTSATLFTDGDDAFEGTTDTTYIIEVLSSGDVDDTDEGFPLVRVTDSSGVDASVTYSLEGGEAIRLGNLGPTFTIAASGSAVEGDIVLVACVAEANGARDIVVLNKSVDMTDVSIAFCVKRNAVEITGAFDSDGITIAENNSDVDVTQGDILVNDTEKALMLISGSLYATYRALLPQDAGTIQSVESTSEVIEALGMPDIDNPLALGVNLALLNSGDNGVYFAKVGSDDSVGYSNVLRNAELSNDVYMFAPLTRDSTILSLVKAHVNELSTPSEKEWRISFFGADAKDGLNIFENDSTGEVLKATSEESIPASGVYDKVIFEEALDYGSYTTRIGDYVYIDYVDGSPEIAARIEGKLTDKEYIVDRDVGNKSVAVKAVVHREFTTSEKAQWVADDSASYFDFRTYNVFPDDIVLDNGQVAGSEYAAAVVAGLKSSVPPQQGLTNVSVNGIASLPRIFEFSKSELNAIAEGGTLILMQNSLNERIYVRHQISTMRSGGQLNTTELNMVTNLDSISYYFADLLEPYKGVYNVTPELILMIDNLLKYGISYLGSKATALIPGQPQLNVDETSIVYVQQDSVYKDNVNIEMNIGLPAPFNGGTVRLVV